MLEINSKLHDDMQTRRKTNATVPHLNDHTVLSANAAAVRLVPARKPNVVESGAETRTRVPVFIGEVTFRGTIPVDGIISGSPGANGGSLSLRQRGRTFFGTDPELIGELSFRDMLRVNGHIAGSVCSKKGTLIIDATAQIDANIEVSVAIISGTVNGDIIAHQRVELGPAARIHGNIWTRSLSIQNGAIFDGVCQMIEGQDQTS